MNCNDYRVATHSELYLTTTGITMTSFKPKKPQLTDVYKDFN